MMRTFLRSKIHRATVTKANVDYEGSITIDPHLIAAADLLPYEKVEIYDVTNGNRFETYVIEGIPGDGEICLNGAAARLVKPGDKVIIASYCILHAGQTLEHNPRLVFVDDKNRVEVLKEGERARTAG